MSNPIHKQCAAFILLAGLVLGATKSQASQARSPVQTPTLQPQVSFAVHYDRSPRLSELAGMPSLQPESGVSQPAQPLPKAATSQAFLPPGEDAALQNSPGAVDMPAADMPAAEMPVAEMPLTDFNFEGVNNVNGVLPPDTNGDVGPNHYIQWVNLSMAIWSLNRSEHSATLVYGPAPGNAIWSGFGGLCETHNDGDPIALYDHLADRWFISQFALNLPNGPFYQCIAVSQTPDPTGAWHRYAFIVSNTKMNDYPKFGVWPDGYYMSVNQFAGPSWAGAGVAVYEREKMLLGQVARQVYFDLHAVNSNFGGMLPADLDGSAPPAGTPNYYAEIDDSTWIPPVDALRLWEFHVDWTNTANSTFGISGNPNAILAVANFAPLCTATRNCIPQPDTTQRLDDLSDRLMHRLQYRHFGAYATLVTNHTVNAGSNRAGVRWYELRRVGGAWGIHQQGTYAGDGGNSEYRWMGSAAMDGMGNLAIGYSLSSNAVHPSIAYTGRLASDPLNTLPQGEAILFSGTGSQTSSSARWGDYSMLSVDPVDDCTFWYTSEYLQTTSSSAWRTRIGSFVFPACTSTQKGTLQGTVSSGATPLANATIQAGGFTTYTDANGFYQFLEIPVGTYTVSATAYGHLPGSASGVVVAYQATTIQDFSLTPLPQVTVSGTVSDGSGQGWPLYARVHITAPGLATTIFTNPVNGNYTINLADSVAHSFEVTAVSPGYLPTTRAVTPISPATTENFSLLVDGATCIAPGYANPGACNPLAGGLLNGNVYDANTGLAVNGASVSSLDAPAETTSTFPTPEDPLRQDGFYILFSSLTGVHDFSASRTNYGDDAQAITISPGGVATASFNIPAGRLVSDPVSLAETLGGSEVVTRTISLGNNGTLEATFSISEVDAAWQALTPGGPYAIPTRHTSPKHLTDLDASAVYEYNPPPAPALLGGQVRGRWPSGLEHIWGIGYDPDTDSLWVGNVAAGGGDNRIYRYEPDGTPAFESIATNGSGAHFMADLTYNPFTRTFWQISVGGGNCLVEIDPFGLRPSGEQICPAFSSPQRGLAYNPLTNSYYSGSWTDGILHHFDSQGSLLESVDTGLNISGLVFNPSTQHLFALVSANQGFDVYVLDVKSGYAILGGFEIAGLGDFQQAGISLDCAGRLWLANQGTQEVLAVESGEQNACLFSEVTWLSASPLSGSVPVGGEQAIAVRIDARGIPAGVHHAQLVISSDTPYGLISLPITLTIEPVLLYLPRVYR